MVLSDFQEDFYYSFGKDRWGYFQHPLAKVTLENLQILLRGRIST
jgi:hypothetical protein